MKEDGQAQVRGARCPGYGKHVLLYVWVGGWVGFVDGGGGKGKGAAMDSARACMLCVSLVLSIRSHRNRRAGFGKGVRCYIITLTNMIQTFSLSPDLYIQVLHSIIPSTHLSSPLSIYHQ